MEQQGLDMKTRWLMPREVWHILQIFQLFTVVHKIPQKPPSGSWFLINRRVSRFFRNDGYQWQRKKNGRTIAEAHEYLKVDNEERLSCYYAHTENNRTFQRRIYWMVDPAYEHIVLVHYRDVSEPCNDRKSTLPSESSNALLPLEAMGDPPLCETKLSFAPFRDQASTSKLSNDKSSLPSESGTALWASLEMTGLPTELKSLEGIMIDANAEPGRLSYLFLRSITRDFSQEIGRGGFGVVYLGDLGGGKVAVKKLNISLGFSDTDFVDEIKCLIQTKHNNVVRFLGYCADTHGELVPLNGSYVIAEVPQRLLCLEYVPNGNLQKYLKDKSYRDEWQIRYKMIRGICHGLNYLHGQRINHLDLKPENILLDACMEPKITDFGLSRCFDEGISRVYTKNIRGTLGCIAPETINYGEITFKSDIYGLGIIIIKLLTGHHNYDFQNVRNIS
uniref:Uncharacterized protein n=1 Tax=Avena sativa TaxID=4498 RepID=A0ACD5TS25_AVESA